MIPVMIFNDQNLTEFALRPIKSVGIRSDRNVWIVLSFFSTKIVCDNDRTWSYMIKIVICLKYIFWTFPIWIIMKTLSIPWQGPTMTRCSKLNGRQKVDGEMKNKGKGTILKDKPKDRLSRPSIFLYFSFRRLLFAGRLI